MIEIQLEFGAGASIQQKQSEERRNYLGED